MKRLFVLFIAIGLIAPASAFWQSRDSNYNVAISTSAPFSLSPTDNGVDLTSQTTYTFTSKSFGAADPTRVMAVIILSRNSAGTQIVSSALIGGVSATKAVAALGSSSAMGGEIWYASVPTGTSGTVSIVFAGANQRCSIQLYSIISPSSAAPTATSISLNAAASTTITIPSGGSVIGGNYNLNGGPGTPVAMPNSPSNGFNNLDLNVNTVGTQQAFAFHSTAGSITGSQSLTMTLTGGSNGAAPYATWGP